MKHIPQNLLRTYFDQWLAGLRERFKLGIAELENPWEEFEAWAQDTEFTEGVAPGDKPRVLQWIRESIPLMGTPARLGRGIGGGMTDTPAVLWVKSLNSVIYGSKVPEKILPIPSSSIHSVIDEMGVHAHKGLRYSKKLSPTRAGILAAKNHAVVALGMVCSDTDVSAYRKLLPTSRKRKFVSGILTLNEEGEFALGEVTRDCETVTDFVSGQVVPKDVRALVVNYLENHGKGSIDVIARTQVCENIDELMRLMAYLKVEVYKAIPQAVDALNKGLAEPKRIHNYLQFFYHSEQWLCETLRNNLNNILGPWMQERVKRKEISEGAKVYALVLDFYSTNDVCLRCQEAIRSLYRNSDQILSPTGKWLQDRGFFIPKNGLRLLARASAHRWFAGGGRSSDPAQNKMLDCPIDVKTLHGNQLFLEAVSEVKFDD